MEALIAQPGELYQVGQATLDFFDVNDSLDATARMTDRAEKGNNRVRTAMANAFKAETGVLTVVQRTAGITTEMESLGKKVSARLVGTPLTGSEDVKEKLTGKFATTPVRLVIVSRETAKMITESIIKTKLHVAACNGADASDGTGTMRPWGFDGLALESLNNPVTSIDRIPHDIDDDAQVDLWVAAFTEAALMDDTKVVCKRHRWTQEGCGAIDVRLADDNDESVMWQIEEWVQDANDKTKQQVDPSGAVMVRTSVAHANPTPVKLKKAIERTDGAAVKIANWCKTNRPGLPWFAATSEAATTSTEEPGSTAVVPGGRHGSFGAFVAHTELAKKETAKTMEAHETQITKANEERCDMKEAIKAMALASQNMMSAIATNSGETKVLSGRVDGIE